MKWESNNDNASISSDGVIKGKNIGNTIVKAKVHDKEYTCKVSVSK